MFEFLKKKLKDSISKISGTIKKSEKLEETSIEKIEEVPKQKFAEKDSKERVTLKEKISKVLFEKKLSENEFNEIFSEIKNDFLENNIAFEVVEKIRESLQNEIVNKNVKRGEEEKYVKKALKNAIEGVLIEGDLNLVINKVKENREKGTPTKFLFVGINGSGKTTTLAKFANWLKKNNFSSVFAASDTFRAASIEQLEKHAINLGIKVIKHQYGADPCAVAFDANEYAKTHRIDCVLIDTAGRQHVNKNLMEELKKIHRVIKPDFVIFVGDSLTGNDVVQQAKDFDKIVPIDFSILTKTDVDKKGGAVISVGYVTKKPILFLGTGQGYDDIKKFNKNEILEMLGLAS
ncbi:MAG: signal recognition particle-docking protein FtsY [Candidatus Parvarchaeota archaeon]|nr:signal recognition particle-docking protein FtsY [Candidatus Jingweiarchaeum tengchongense]MCW1298229.1 signal recognition particle-docking protein FtsY [Candidatus Jingweiarchaeum tengchongense]MCW1300027.1 signal recognition particle-docking protein FtsY [Candidatus Jingweiarchaeum tengchongense]MCW1304834.1 signal recognition particle-docking protein FtsY [Candidatus Jingweiarchaeum tengchongense]MCW1305424.1 signal recognition particle-docking protein FtsY [Candidatus Jingweiarchaeum ten